MTHLEGSVRLMAEMLKMASCHIIELPDRPWLQHVHDAFPDRTDFVKAAIKESGREFNLVGPIFSNEWYGKREVWVVEEPEGAPACPEWKELMPHFEQKLLPDALAMLKAFGATVGGVGTAAGLGVQRAVTTPQRPLAVSRADLHHPNLVGQRQLLQDKALEYEPEQVEYVDDKENQVIHVRKGGVTFEVPTGSLT